MEATCMKKINIIVFAALVMLILSSCGQTDASQPSSYDWLPEAKSPDEILLYDRFNQRFVTYNLKTYTIVNKNPDSVIKLRKHMLYAVDCR